MLEDIHVFTCPHCEDQIVIEKLRCGIFRHGVMKKTNRSINPHTSQKGQS